jgi:hypothetical protein
VNTHLVVSFVGKKIVFFRPMDQKLWVFEVSRRSLGRAGMCWSQLARIDHLRKKWRAGRKKNSRKMRTVWQVQASTHGRRPEVAIRGTTAQGWPATSSHPPAAGRHLRLSGCPYFFEIFLFKKEKFLEVWEMG